MNFEFATQRPCAFFHAPHSQSLILAQTLQIESATVVSDDNFQAFVDQSEVDLRHLRAAMFFQVSQAFLNDAKNTQGGVGIYRPRNFGRDKVDSDLLIGSEFLAQGGDGRDKSETLERG